MAATTVTAEIAACWKRGNSIAETIEIAKRRHQVVVTFDEVRALFVELSRAEAA